MKRLYALGDVAHELGVEQHRFAYVLKTRRWIRPIGRVASCCQVIVGIILSQIMTLSY
jgi:hypothetical protein